MAVKVVDGIPRVWADTSGGPISMEFLGRACERMGQILQQEAAQAAETLANNGGLPFRTEGQEKIGGRGMG